MKRKDIGKLFSRRFFSTAATYAESDIYPSRRGILKLHLYFPENEFNRISAGDFSCVLNSLYSSD